MRLSEILDGALGVMEDGAGTVKAAKPETPAQTRARVKRRDAANAVVQDTLETNAIRLGAARRRAANAD